MDNTDLVELQELVAHIQHSNPAIKALLVSFQELGVVESSLQRIGLCGWLHQPITQSMLLKAISNCCSSEAFSEFIQLRMTDREDGSGNQEYHSYQAQILLVEDNPVNQKLAIELLRVFEVSVEVANNGQEALEKIQSTDFEELKSWETPSNLPVVYITQEEVVNDLEDVDALLIPLEEPLVKRKVRQLITKLETFLQEIFLRLR